MEEGPGPLEPLADSWVWTRVSGGRHNDYRLIYFGEHQPSGWRFGLPQGVTFQADWIDTWEMTIETLPGTYGDQDEIPLPGRPRMALRLRPLPMDAS
jgi:hypothetical protein